MAELVWLIPLGVAVGAVGTLMGAGGGFVLVPLLVLLYPAMPADVVTAVSLTVVFFNALSGSIAYARMGRVDYPAAILFAAAGVPGAILGAMSTAYVPQRAFEAIIGVVLLAASVFLILRPGGTRREAPAGTAGDVRPATPAYRTPRKMALGATLSTGVGFLSSLLGIGGGIIHVPVLVGLLGFPVHVATATSHMILAILALAGVLVHVSSGTFASGAWETIGLAAGVVVGAQVGAAVSPRVGGRWIMRGLASALGLVAVRILAMAGGLWR
jgi:uncharacterized membrane protein YfcA